MIRVAWRQFRLPACIAVGFLVVAAIVFGVTGPHLSSVYHAYLAELARCRRTRACAQVSDPVATTDQLLANAGAVVLVVAPAILGIFWGAPLIARELETGTFRLAWTQSVTRTRWLVVKLALGAVASMAFCGLYTFMLNWWESPLNHVEHNDFSLSGFGLHGITPIGYGAFAFALGATLGLLFRRTLPAMATTLVVYIAAREGDTYGLRAHYAAPETMVRHIGATTGFGLAQTPAGVIVQAPTVTLPNAWVLSARYVGSHGNQPTAAWVARNCPNLPGQGGTQGPGVVHHAVGASQIGVTGPAPASKTAFLHCAATVASQFHEVVMYQPASRFAGFQVIETALFLVVAVLLGALCVWWARRRLG